VLSWDEIEKVGLGKLRLKFDELYDMLPYQFFIMVEGFFELETERDKREWERCRWQTCLLLNIHLPKNKILKPTDLFRFKGERKTKTHFDKLRERAEYIKKMEDSKKIDNGK
jgi:hypothetical protein